MGVRHDRRFARRRHQVSLLQRKPVSDVKREGWRGVMKCVDAAGKLLMTNHDRPEAVILSLQEFELLTELAESAQRDKQHKLEALSQAFDAELAVLRQADAADRLRQAFGAPLALKGEVIAGRSYWIRTWPPKVQAPL
jgi:PHD/YefM family antitoxin component YafN of YafNO toxin-antitoxin module